MKNIAPLSLLLTIAASLSACGGSGGNTTASTQPLPSVSSSSSLVASALSSSAPQSLASSSILLSSPSSASLRSSSSAVASESQPSSITSSAINQSSIASSAISQSSITLVASSQTSIALLNSSSSISSKTASSINSSSSLTYSSSSASSLALSTSSSALNSSSMSSTLSASSMSSADSSSRNSSSSKSSSSVNTNLCLSATFTSGGNYAAGTLVQHLGNEYRCTVGGWCSSTSDWAYAPGSGTYWTQAWELVRACSAGASSLASSSLSSTALSSTATSTSSSLATKSSASAISANSSSIASSTGSSASAAATPNKEFNKTYQQTANKIIVSYFVEWGIYGRNYHVSDIPASNITHLLFGFLAICGDNHGAAASAQQAIAAQCAGKKNYEITLVDHFADLEKTYPGDTWYDDVDGQNYNGNFGQLRKLKQKNPALKILPSVGGWTMSTPYYTMAKSDANRAVFVASAMAFLKKYDFFDGLDIDWEYPVLGGTDPELSTAADRDGYTKLMRDLRAGLDALSKETGKTYQLTSAVGAAPDKISAVDYAAASPYMDYIFAMTYDYVGNWESATGHHAPLNNNKGTHVGYNAADSVQNLLAAGVTSTKIVMGGAFYGRGWSKVKNTNTHAPELFPLYGNGVADTHGTWENGIFDYRDLYNNYIGPQGSGINGFSVHYDTTAEAPYLWNAATEEFISYENAQSLKAKANYIKQFNLGGILTWEIDGDNGHLLNAINEGLGNTEIK